MKSLTKFGALIAFLGGQLAAASGVAQAQDAQLPEITIAVPITDSVFGLPYVAQVNGYFDDAGVKVNFMDAFASNALNLIAGGQADITFFGTALSFSLVAQGKPTTVIYNFSGGGLGGMLVANNAYKDLAALSGKRVGTVGFNGSSYGYAQLYSDLVVKNGGEKFNIVPLNDPATLANSVKSGQVDAATGPEGWFTALLKDGSGNVVIDTKDTAQREKYVGGYYAENSMFGLTDNLKDKRTAVVRYLKGIDKALEWVRSHTPEEYAALLVEKAGPFKTISLEAETVSTNYTKHFWSPERGRISKEMWDASRKQYALWNLKNVKVGRPEFDYEQRVDMSYLDEALKP